MNKQKKTIDVDYIAGLAKLEIDESKKSRFQEEMQNIVDYVDLLSELNVENIIPTAHAAQMKNVWREDVSENDFSREVMLKNAPELFDEGTIKVPQVLPGEGTA
ncbi:MAG: Asp-tRNA(Asn)/Glu-tRNA(Gln) amidotransferase subunit GatC [Victivallales bacterium]|nr:Asp-tRNA(Asn)/Glu-tRNA(Gln) amidotransferase subunit GatC [Victivallales bacterium]MCF7888763.1 Asp-tRNA(Asn)/Glu-tRNA(Gln) amidotransferase subunit GatC [Victivallales bacterium]